MDEKTPYRGVRFTWNSTAKAYQRHIAYFESLGFDITNPPSISGKEYALGDIFTLSNAVAPPPELWNGEDDAECALA